MLLRIDTIAAGASASDPAENPREDLRHRVSAAVTLGVMTLMEAAAMPRLDPAIDWVTALVVAHEAVLGIHRGVTAPALSLSLQFPPLAAQLSPSREKCSPEKKLEKE